jgi:hypothetical protein
MTIKSAHLYCHRRNHRMKKRREHLVESRSRAYPRRLPHDHITSQRVTHYPNG